MFKCATCNILYATYQSLLKHAKKKNHSMPCDNEITTNVYPNEIACTSNSSSGKKKLPIRDSEANSKTSLNTVTPSPQQQPQSYQLFFLNGVNTLINSQPVILLGSTSTSQATKSSNTSTSFDENRFSAVACQTIVQEVSMPFTLTQEAGSQTVYLGDVDLFEASTNTNQFNLSSSTSPLNFDSLYNSQETQTIIQNLNNSLPAVSTTQEAGSQTVYTNEAIFYPVSSNTQTASTSTATTATTSTNFQTDEYCLDAGTSTYLDMYLSDISTQTNSQLQFDEAHNLHDSFYYMNATSFAPIKLQKEPAKTSTLTTYLADNDRESMTTPPASSIFSNSTCQTDNFYFENSINTNSIQTQTSSNLLFNSQSQVVNTKTQTEWGN